MDKPGHLPGGQISEVMNIHSRKLYMVSTAPEIGQDYWSTAVFPVVDRRFLFGLIRRNVPDFHHQLVSGCIPKLWQLGMLTSITP
jgi:hypothetical protein